MSLSHKMKNEHFISFVLLFFLSLFPNRVISQATITHTTGTGGFQTVNPYNGTINLPTFDPFLGELTKVEFGMSVDIIMLGSTYEISNYTEGIATLDASGANAFIHDFDATFYGATLDETTTLPLTGSDSFKGPTPASYYIKNGATEIFINGAGLDRAIGFLGENSCADAAAASGL